jgi:hypothetical protein
MTVKSRSAGSMLQWRGEHPHCAWRALHERSENECCVCRVKYFMSWQRIRCRATGTLSWKRHRRLLLRNVMCIQNVVVRLTPSNMVLVMPKSGVPGNAYSSDLQSRDAPCHKRRKCFTPVNHLSQLPILLEEFLMELRNSIHPIRAWRQERCPKMQSSFFLSKARSRDKTDPCCVKELEAVEYVWFFACFFGGVNSLLRKCDAWEEIHGALVYR